MKTLYREMLDADLLAAMLADCETIKPSWKHEVVNICASGGICVKQPQRYELRKGNALFIKNLDGFVYIENIQQILKTDTMFQLSTEGECLVLKTTSATFRLKVRALRETDMLLPIALEVPSPKPDPRAEVEAKYAWIERWEADETKRMYKATIANGKANRRAELAALDAINVTAEFQSINTYA